MDICFGNFRFWILDFGILDFFILGRESDGGWAEADPLVGFDATDATDATGATGAIDARFH